MQCYTGILHCIAKAPSVFNRLVHLFTSSYFKAGANCCPLIHHCYAESSRLVYAPIGYNWRCKRNYVNSYSEDDFLCSSVVQDIRLQQLTFDFTEQANFHLFSVCCD